MKMKLVGISLATAVLFAGTAMAIECDPRFYVGGEVQAHKNKGPKALVTETGVFERADRKPWFGKSGSGATALTGIQFNENVAVEVGATRFNRTKIHFRNVPNFNQSSIKNDTYNLYADVLGILPVAQDVDLFASLGAGHLTSKVKGRIEERGRFGHLRSNERVSLKSKKTQPRFGAGVGYNFNKDLSARLMFRHQKGNKFVKDVNSVGLGLIWKF